LSVNLNFLLFFNQVHLIVEMSQDLRSMIVIYFESANYASASQTYSPIIIDIDSTRFSFILVLAFPF